MLRNWARLAIVALGLNPSSARADLIFPEPSADLGEVRSGVPVVHSFAFRNSGPGPVTITAARASCGCATPRLERTTILPGETGSLLLHVHTLSQPEGPNRWRVSVQYQDGETSRSAELAITAKLVKEILVEPSVLRIFADGPVSHEIRVNDRRPVRLALTSVATTSAHLTAQVLSEADDGLRRVRLQVEEALPVGDHEEALTLYSTDPAYRELVVPVTIIKRSRQGVRAVPEAVSWNAAVGQALPSRVVLVRDAQDRPVEVERVEADDPAVTCRFAAGPGPMATVKVQVDAGRIGNSPWQTAVRVHIRQPATEVLVIPVSLTVR